MSNGEWSKADHDALITLIAEVEAFDRLVTDRRTRDNAQLILQAQEYERRLNDLNHAHQEALRVQSTYIDKGTHDVAMNRLDEKATDAARLLAADLASLRGRVDETLSVKVYEAQHAELINRLAILETWRTTINARIAVFVGASFLGGGVVGAITGHLVG